MLNKMIIVGRLTADPEFKETQSGVSRASFAIACDRDYADQDGKRQTDFFNVVAWRGTADFVCKHFTKGQLINIVGRLEQRRYTDDEGTTRNLVNIKAENIYFVGSKRDNGKSDESFDPSVEVDGEFYELTSDDDCPF